MNCITGSASLMILLLTLTACGTTKEMRRSNRAANKLERLVERFPEMKRIDSITIPITMKTPEIKGGFRRMIYQPMDVAGVETAHSLTTHALSTHAPSLIPPTYFEDESLSARISLVNGEFSLDYTIKSMPVDTLIQVPCPTIQPTRYEPLPLKWWQTALMCLGGFYIARMLIRLAFDHFKISNKL